MSRRTTSKRGLFGDGKPTNVVVKVQNDGFKIPAESVQISAQLKFLKPDQERTFNSFSVAEPQFLHSLDGQGPEGVLYPLRTEFDNAGYHRITVIKPADYSAYNRERPNCCMGTVRFRDS